jgi:dTDP-glucose pyrophosphorylase
VSTPRVCVIAAAGSAGPVRSRGADVPKVLLEVAGKPVLARQLELVRDELGIRKVYLIVDRPTEQPVRAAYRDGRDMGLEIHYVPDWDLRRGLGTAVLAAEPHVREPFVFLLGNECWLESNLRELPSVAGPYDAVWGVLQTDDPDLTRRRWGVTVAGDRITAVVDRGDASSPYVGCGAWVLSPAIHRFAHETPASARSGRLELTEVLDRAARSGAVVKPFAVRGRHAIVDGIPDRNAASYLFRSAHFERHRVSLVVPTYNEAASIGAVLRDFRPHVWEIVVVDNSSPDGTAEIARGLGATVISRPTRGIGDAARQGLDAARGDILVIAEGDGTFRARDLGKLLEFLKDADMVVGTRTARELVEPGANMDGLLRFANVLWGKIIEGLWWNLHPRFTDVGCTYRALWRDAWLAIRDSVVDDGAPFGPEMVIEMMRARRRVIEVPVNYYRRRAGESKHSASLWQSAGTGMRMLRTILKRRLDLR